MLASITRTHGKLNHVLCRTLQSDSICRMHQHVNRAGGQQQRATPSEATSFAFSSTNTSSKHPTISQPAALPIKMVNNKKKKKKDRRCRKEDTAKRIEKALADANAIQNPVQGLESLMEMEIKQNQQDGGVDEIENDKTKISIQYYASPLPSDLLDSCMKMFETNMSDLYRQSQWGLDLKEKQLELTHENAKFLICTNNAKELLGFAHFRFDTNDDDTPTEPVLYVYELQISKKLHRCGLGRRLMIVMEFVALKAKLPKVMLTVFHANQAAMVFYRDKLKYVEDETSPGQYELSADDAAADYDILSKVVYRGG